MGCCLWGRTESDTTEATQQQQQQGIHLKPWNVYAKQKQTSNYQGGERRGERQISGMGLTEITMYKVDKQQGYTVSHREL